jgi:glucokinase
VSASLGLVADIGGTNARFALVEPDGTIVQSRYLAAADYPTLEEALADYLAIEKAKRPRVAALAVAAAVTGDTVAFTNHPWRFSVGAVKRHFGFAHFAVVNDFEANALALPRLGPADRRQVGGGEAASGAPLVVLGPGSGLGVAGMVPLPHGGWKPLPGEGGHATMAAAGERESAVLDRMRAQFGHVSAERVLSGPGLVNLYTTLAEIDGIAVEPLTPAQVADAGLRGADLRAREAVEMFCAMLGTIAGNVALTLGARGGVFIAGGIVPKLGPPFDVGPFRARFEAKGRFAPYLAAIPTFVVTHPVPAFVGLAGLTLDAAKKL